MNRVENPSDIEKRSDNDARRRSLLVQATMFDVILICAAAVTLGPLGLWSRGLEWQHQLEAQANTSAQLVASQAEYGLVVGNREEIQRIADSARGSEDVLYVAIEDEAGRILATSGEKGGADHAVRDASGPLGALAGPPARVEIRRAVFGAPIKGLSDWGSSADGPRKLGSVFLIFSAEKERQRFLRTGRILMGWRGLSLESCLRFVSCGSGACSGR